MSWIIETLSSANTKTLFVGALVLIIAYFIRSSRRFRNLPPGPLALPIVGNLPIIAKSKKNLHLLFHKLSQDYGDIFSIFIGPKLFIVLSSLKSMKAAVIDQADIFNDRIVNKKPTLDILNRLLNSNYSEIHGVLLTNGEPWKQLRKMTIMAFRDFGVGKKALDEQIQVEANFVVNELEKLEGEPLNIKHLLTNAVSNIICSIVFGKRFYYDDTDFKSILKALEESFQNASGLSAGKTSFLSKILEKLFKKKLKSFGTTDSLEEFYKFIIKLLKEHRESFDENDIRDYMDLFIKHQNENQGSPTFSDVSLISNILQLFGAGTETTNTTLRWILVYLLHNPDVQEKCYAELERVIGTEKQPEYKDRHECPYIWATIHEIQRISSMVPIAVPHCCNKDTKLQGYDIPKGAIIFINTYTGHMDPNIWDEPTKFKPERFIDENGKFFKKEEFLPFSIGKRFCLGEQLAKMELFLFTTILIQRFVFKPENERNLPDLDGILGITLSPNDFRVRAVKR